MPKSVPPSKKISSVSRFLSRSWLFALNRNRNLPPVPFLPSFPITLRSKTHLNSLQFSVTIYASAAPKTALLNDMHLRHTAPNTPTLRAPGLPIHRDLGLMSSSFPGLLTDPSLPRNPDKTQTKCIQKHECYIFIAYAPTTYNFNTLKCPQFLAAPLSHNLTLNLNPDLHEGPSFASLHLCV
jgi:hypothetical protein